MRTILFHFAIFMLPVWASAQTDVRITIEGADVNGGKIFVSIFNNEKAYKAREVFSSYVINADNEIAIMQLNLPHGEYLFSAFQDGNGNGNLDTNLIGIPKEKFGFSNYDGKSTPGGFHRHKIVIGEISGDVLLALYKI